MVLHFFSNLCTISINFNFGYNVIAKLTLWLLKNFKSSSEKLSNKVPLVPICTKQSGI